MSNGASKIQKDAAPKGKRHKLYLQSLKFLSIVDRPAMEPATIALIKSADGDRVSVTATARIVKTSDELVWGWAFVSKVDGKPYTDLQGDELDEESMLEVAKDFMSGARASDTQHDEKATGEVVFGMPMTADIAKAFGVETDTHGLMIAVRPDPEVMARVKAGELTGFSLGGTGIREPIAEKRAEFIAKAAALTGITDGHQHLVDLDRQSGSTSYESATPGGYGHCHPVVINDGVVTIGMAYGHAHDTPSTTEKRAPAVKADPAAPTTSIATSNSNPETTMTTDADRIKHLEAEVAKYRALAELTDVEKAHAKTLDDDARAVYLAKAAPDRRAIAEQANEVVYKAADGTVYRRSDDPRLAELAKRADAREAEAQAVTLEKRAIEVFKNLGGTRGDQALILKALDAHVTDAATHARCVAILKANTESAAFGHVGFQGGTSAADIASPAADQLHKMAEDRVKATGESIAVAKAWLLDHDRKAQQLKQQADAERRAARRGRA